MTLSKPNPINIFEKLIFYHDENSTIYIYIIYIYIIYILYIYIYTSKFFKQRKQQIIIKSVIFFVWKTVKYYNALLLNTLYEEVLLTKTTIYIYICIYIYKYTYIYIIYIYIHIYIQTQLKIIR